MRNAKKKKRIQCVPLSKNIEKPNKDKMLQMAPKDKMVKRGDTSRKTKVD